MTISTGLKQDAGDKFREVRQQYKQAVERTYASMQDLEVAWAKMEEYRAMYDTNDPDQAAQLDTDNAWLDDKLTDVLISTGGPTLPQSMSVTLAYWIDIYIENMRKNDGVTKWTRQEVLDNLTVANIPSYVFSS
jgi:hypothetical protein